MVLTSGLSNQAIPLGALASNGGPTQTHALLPASPAIDAGDNIACAASPVSSQDQRGIARPADGNGDSTLVCDIGAFEFLAPAITLDSAVLNYDEGDPATRIDAAAVLADDAPDYAGGSLTVTLGGAVSADDRLAILSEAPITTSGGFVLFNGAAVIGSYSGSGCGAAPLVVALNANANPANVQALLRAVTYQNLSIDPGSSSRTASFLIDDGRGTTGVAATRAIQITPIDILPVLTGFSKSLNEDGFLRFTALDFTGNFEDGDGEPLEKIKIVALPANGVLDLDGDYVTLDQEILLADLPSLGYTPNGNYYGPDGFDWNAADATAYSIAAVTTGLSILPVNDPPTLDVIADRTIDEDAAGTGDRRNRPDGQLLGPTGQPAGERRHRGGDQQRSIRGRGQPAGARLHPGQLAGPPDGNRHRPGRRRPGRQRRLRRPAGCGAGAQVQVPAGGVTQEITLHYQPLSAVADDPGFSFSGLAFDLTAYDSNGSPIGGFAFAVPVTVTLAYTDEDVAGQDEDRLTLKYWTGSAWEDAASGAYARDPERNTVSVTIGHLSRFGLFSPQVAPPSSTGIYLPLIVR